MDLILGYILSHLIRTAANGAIARRSTHLLEPIPRIDFESDTVRIETLGPLF